MIISFKSFAKGRPFCSELQRLATENKIPPAHAELMLNTLSPTEQEIFLFEAMHFTYRSFKSIIGRWSKFSPTKQESMLQILDDVKDAFDNWDAWKGNRIGDDEIEEHEQMVAKARGRVLAYLHGLSPTPINKII